MREMRLGGESGQQSLEIRRIGRERSPIRELYIKVGAYYKRDHKKEDLRGALLERVGLVKTGAY